MGDVWGSGWSTSSKSAVEDVEWAKREEEEERSTAGAAAVVTPPSLAQLSALASQRYVYLYTASTIRAFPEPVQEVLLRVMDKSDQTEKLGEYKAWHPNGQLWCHERYDHDDHKPRGVAAWWHPNGSKWREETYDEQGRKHGLARWWHPNGQLRTEALYEEGREVVGSYRAWTALGNPSMH